MSIDVTVSGESRSVEPGTTAAALFDGDRSVLVARVNGELKDLTYSVQAGDVIEPVGADDPEGLAVLRHSTTHVMAQAVQSLFPDAKLGIGPPIKDGFYYDFMVDQPFHPDDLTRIEKKMVEILKAGQTFQPSGSHRGRGASGTGQRALQDRADRQEGRQRRRDHGDRRLRADRLRQRRPARCSLLVGPVPGAARTEHPLHPAERGQADAHRRGVLACPTSATRSCSASTAPPGRARTSSRST
ncbi:MAG: hypothetical protein V9G10_06710 [Candidatus Nanopelagicales bacterium]